MRLFSKHASLHSVLVVKGCNFIAPSRTYPAILYSTIFGIFSLLSYVVSSFLYVSIQMDVIVLIPVIHTVQQILTKVIYSQSISEQVAKGIENICF